MIRVLSAAMLGILVLAQQPQGNVSQSELGAPGTAPHQAAPAPAPQAQAPQVKAQPAPAAPAAPTAQPAEVQPQERDRVQSNKPVAAFWTVIPGR